MFIQGERLFRSTDRGTTWEEAGAPGPQAPNADISAVSAREAWALVPGSPATQCQGQTVEILHTVDTGASWQRQAASGIGNPGCKIALSFVDATRAFFAASDPNAPPVIYRTTDAAKTWAPSAPLADPPGFASQGGAALRPGPVRALGGVLLVDASGGNPQRDYVFRSTDGGAMWTFFRLPPAGSPVAFVTETRWLELIGPGESQETVDGGATWHAYASDYSQAAPVPAQVVFGDPLVGYATVRGGLQRTTDGGLHWTALKTPGT